jgi:hypothetical protein
MTTVQITLPDTLANEATRAGLLAPKQIETILRERLAAARIDRLKAVRAELAADPMPAMTADEVRGEIDAYRAEQRRAAGC